MKKIFLARNRTRVLQHPSLSTELQKHCWNIVTFGIKNYLFKLRISKTTSQTFCQSWLWFIFCPLKQICPQPTLKLFLYFLKFRNNMIPTRRANGSSYCTHGCSDIAVLSDQSLKNYLQFSQVVLFQYNNCRYYILSSRENKTLKALGW